MFKGKTLERVESLISPEHKEIIDKAQDQLKQYEDMLLSRLQVEHPASCSIRSEVSMSAIVRQFQGDPLRMKLIDAISTLKMFYEIPRFIVVDEK